MRNNPEILIEHTPDMRAWLAEQSDLDEARCRKHPKTAAAGRWIGGVVASGLLAVVVCLSLVGQLIALIIYAGDDIER